MWLLKKGISSASRISLNTQVPNGTLTVEKYLAFSFNQRRAFVHTFPNKFLTFAKENQNSNRFELIDTISQGFRHLDMTVSSNIKYVLEFMKLHSNSYNRDVLQMVVDVYDYLLKTNVKEAYKPALNFANEHCKDVTLEEDKIFLLSLAVLYKMLVSKQIQDAYKPALDFANENLQGYQYHFTDCLLDLFLSLLVHNYQSSKKAALEFANRYSNKK